MRNTSERKKRKQPTELSDTAIEGFLRDAFEANYARLRYETGHALSLELKEAAWQQIHLYWQRLHDLARRVTETEVRLVLPNQKTPNGRTFGIEVALMLIEPAKIQFHLALVRRLKWPQLEFYRHKPA